MRVEPIPLTVVHSGMLTAFGYDAESQTLALQFRSGKIHHYGDVPPKVWEELKLAASLGQYFQNHIRDKFPSQAVSYERKEQ